MTPPPVHPNWIFLLALCEKPELGAGSERGAYRKPLTRPKPFICVVCLSSFGRTSKRGDVLHRGGSKKDRKGLIEKGEGRGREKRVPYSSMTLPHRWTPPQLHEL